MLSFLSSILDFFGYIINLVKFIVTGLVQFFMSIPKITAFLTTAPTFVPTFLLVYFTFSVTMTIVLVVINRKG